jgi:hypothetical protein
VFEGDDSLCAWYPYVLPGSEFEAKFLAWWTRLGFNMELIIMGRPGPVRATFAGYNLSIDSSGTLTGYFCPEVPRAFRNRGISVSSYGKESFHEADGAKARRVAIAAMSCAAVEFAGIFPTISRKYLEYAEYLGCDDVTEVQGGQEVRDMSFFMCGYAGASSAAAAALAAELNLQVNPLEEHAALLALGYGANELELDVFRSYVWDWDNLQDHEGFAASLPITWK